MESSTKHSLFLSSILLLLVLLFSSAAGSSPVGFVGGYEPIHNLKDQYVVDVAKFALTEHNKNQSDNLVFFKLSSAQQQLVSGTNYKLNIVARHAARGPRAHYLAIVYDKPWGDKIRTLTSFHKA